MELTLLSVTNVVRDFVARTRGGEAQKIDVDTPLLQEGYLDSFAFAEFIVELEGRLGSPLPDGALIPEDFESPRVLWARLEDLKA